jgi:hypothetical protein
MRIDRFSDFKVNEIFGIGKPLPYDGIAKENFKKLLDNLEDVKVNKYADYKREVLINLKSKKSEETNDKVQEGQVVGLKKKIPQCLIVLRLPFMMRLRSQIIQMLQKLK